MPDSDRNRIIAPDWFKIILGLPMILAVLWFGRGLLELLSVALLIFVLSSAFMDRLSAITVSGRVIPTWAARVLAAVIFISVLWLFSVVSSIAAQEIIEAVPRYQERLSDLVVEAQAFLGAPMVEAINQALTRVDLGGLVVFLAGGLIGSIAQVSLLTLYLLFLITERSDWQAKIRIVSAKVPGRDRDNADFEMIVHRAAQGIKDYMWVNAVTSAMSGTVAYVIFSLIDLDFAAFLAMIVFFVGFIPNIGAFIGIALPALVALVQFDSLWPFLAVVLGYGLADQFISNVITPMMQGRSLNISTFMVMVALVFWSILWGGLGAFLAVPLTVIVMVIAAEVPSLRWLAVLLSRDGDLAALRGRPEARESSAG